MTEAVGLHARAGEAVFCLEGHQLGVVAHDLYDGMICRPTMLKNLHPGWVLPQLGKIPPCPVCGAHTNTMGSFLYADRPAIPGFWPLASEVAETARD